MSTLKIAGFLDHSTVNGEGFRSTLFLSGCLHNCKNCHNKAMQDFDYGDTLSISTLIEKIKKNLPIIDGITISGGDPFEQSANLHTLLNEIKALGLSVWVYTGYTYDYLLTHETYSRLLPFIDVLVDGPFIEALKTDSKKYVGSSNQRILRLVDGKIAEELHYK